MTVGEVVLVVICVCDSVSQVLSVKSSSQCYWTTCISCTSFRVPL